MYLCSNCGLLVGPEDASQIDEPSRPCPACRKDYQRAAEPGE